MKEIFFLNSVSGHNSASSGTAGRKSSRIRAGKKVLTSARGPTCVGECVRVCSAHPDNQATLLVVSLSVDTYRNPQKQTDSRGFPDSLFEMKPRL